MKKKKRTKWVKRIVLFGFLGMMLGKPLFVEARHYNEYRSKEYEDDVEALQELEGILKKDGYLLVDVHSDFGKKLRADEKFWYSHLMNEQSFEFYHVYVYPDDVKEWEAGDITMLNENAVLVSYYETMIPDGPQDGPYDNDIPDDWECGNISIVGFLEDGIRGTGCSCSCILYNDLQNYIYSFELNDGNDWALNVRVPIGRYRVETIYTEGKKAPYASCDNEVFTLTENGLERVYVGIGDADIPDAPEYNIGESQEETIEEPQTEGGATETESVTALVSSGEETAQAVKKPQKNKNYLPLVLIMIGLIGIFAAAVPFFKKVREDKEKEQEEC